MFQKTTTKVLFQEKEETQRAACFKNRSSSSFVQEDKVLEPGFVSQLTTNKVLFHKKKKKKKTRRKEGPEEEQLTTNN